MFQEINRICEPCDIAEFTIENLGDTNAYLDLTYEIPPKASEVFVIGNPEGFENTVSTGIISSIRNDVNKVKVGDEVILTWIKSQEKGILESKWN